MLGVRGRMELCCERLDHRGIELSTSAEDDLGQRIVDRARLAEAQTIAEAILKED